MHQPRAELGGGVRVLLDDLGLEVSLLVVLTVRLGRHSHSGLLLGSSCLHPSHLSGIFLFIAVFGLRASAILIFKFAFEVLNLLAEVDNLGDLVG